jgi:tetratricopeptide (TPR) repeat protein
MDGPFGNITLNVIAGLIVVVSVAAASSAWRYFGGRGRSQRLEETLDRVLKQLADKFPTQPDALAIMIETLEDTQPAAVAFVGQALSQIAAGYAEDALSVIADLRKLPLSPNEEMIADVLLCDALLSASRYTESAEAMLTLVEARNLGPFADILELYLLKVAETFCEIGNKEYEARIWSALGNLRRNQERYADAANAFEQAKQIFGELRSEKSFAIACVDAADAYYFLDQNAESRENISTALKIGRRLSDPWIQASALISLGRVDVKTEPLTTAEITFEGALVIARQHRLQLLTGNALFSLARIHRLTGREREALGEIREAVEIFEVLSIPGGLANVLALRGLIFLGSGSLVDAETDFLRAIGLFERTGALRSRNQTALDLGNVYVQRDEWNRAKSVYQTSLKFFHERGLLDDEASALTHLGSLLAKEGHFRQAEAYLRKAQAMHHKVGNVCNEAYAIESLGWLFRMKEDWLQSEDEYRQAFDYSIQLALRPANNSLRNGSAS